MKQGEIWKVYFDPIKGNEQAGVRPAVIISGDTMNNKSKLKIVCPLTSSLHNFKNNPILEPNEINGLKSISEILVFQIRTLSDERFKNKIGNVNSETIDEIHSSLSKLLKY
ncbi:type II toxin-antitoxin system PemK/MazF family toxin [Aequorivita sp. H23M31]|uniref:mRNA interferase n=1 Tax=Aequorivita ciconiae TaxID=2494375 RepID=A0A410G6E3_9FLAO|nr:type II toxin-antitoxin system PemK/MazF family toxin [Aequorivita sp. H23M31]QAA82791.1 type II toxin-antitoxin system PemK/MazF family toxin [Aequorivita sp. H23M31]